MKYTKTIIDINPPDRNLQEGYSHVTSEGYTLFVYRSPYNKQKWQVNEFQTKLWIPRTTAPSRDEAIELATNEITEALKKSGLTFNDLIKNKI